MGRYISQDPIGLKGEINFYQYPFNPVKDIDPLGPFTYETCNDILDAANKQLDKLPFNPSKMATAYLNADNAGRLYATGLIKMGVGILADGTVVLAPAGVASISWGGVGISNQEQQH